MTDIEFGHKSNIHSIESLLKISIEIQAGTIQVNGEYWTATINAFGFLRENQKVIMLQSNRYANELSIPDTRFPLRLIVGNLLTTRFG